MKKRLLYLIAIVGILAVLIIPLATPVMAAAPTLPWIHIWGTDPFNETGNGTSNQDYSATFTGTGLSSTSGTITGVAFLFLGYRFPGLGYECHGFAGSIVRKPPTITNLRQLYTSQPGLNIGRWIVS